MYRFLYDESVESERGIGSDELADAFGLTAAAGGLRGCLHINEQRSHRPFFSWIEVQPLVVIVIRLWPTNHVCDWPPARMNSDDGSL